MDPIFLYPALAVIGILVGIVSAALGIGGGVLMVPAFTLIYPQMDINTAKGSSLFVITFVAGYNAFKMNRGHMRNAFSVVLLVAAGSLTGGYLGGWVTSLMPDRTVSWIFVGLVAFAGIRFFLLHPPIVDEDSVRRRNALSVLIGLATGVVSGATGTGGGAILVPLALWAGIASNERVVALSNTVMVATCLSGTLAHALASPAVDMPWTCGLVNVSFAPVVVLSALLAAPAGRWVNARLSFRRRQWVMGVLLVAIALRLFYRMYQPAG